MIVCGSGTGSRNDLSISGQLTSGIVGAPVPDVSTSAVHTDWFWTCLLLNGLLTAGMLGALIGSALVRLGWF